jgi:hypothetical protein
MLLDLICVTGQPTVVVQGDRLNAQCKAILSKAGRGDQVTISENVSYR